MLGQIVEPDLVLLDLGLPLVSGYVVLQELAAKAQAQAVPVVIVVTGQIGPHTSLPHARCVLQKPVSPDKLVDTVRQCLAEGSPAQGT